MHELSLCESVVETLEKEALAQQFQKVKTVWLEIGALSGVEAEAMSFCFDSVSRGTVADAARLEIIAVPGRAFCEACAGEVFVEQRYDVCPLCGSFPLEIIDGDQMRIKELEVV